MDNQATQTDASDSPSDDLLRRFLSDRDALCPGCRYNLRGLASNRCPECGIGLELGIVGIKPGGGAWVLLIACWCACGGLGIIPWVYLFNSGWSLNVREGLRFPFAFFLLSPIIGAICIALRKRFLQLEEQTQWILAWVSVLLMAITFGIVATN